MSLVATRWAWSQEINSVEKLVLLALADAVNSQGARASCWPSVQRLMDVTRLARRTVFKVLSSLEKKTLLIREPGKQGRSTVYRLQISNERTAGWACEMPSAEARPAAIEDTIQQDSARTPHADLSELQLTPPEFLDVVEECILPASYADPLIVEDQLNIPNEPQGGEMVMEQRDLPTLDQNSAAEMTAAVEVKATKPRKPPRGQLTADQQARFDRFWEIYPRRVAKAEARKAWVQVSPDQSLFDRICMAIESAKRCSQWQRDGGRYIPHPATWLRREGWADEHQVAVPNELSGGDKRVQGTVDAINWLFGSRDDEGTNFRQGNGVSGRGVQPGTNAGEGCGLLGSAQGNGGRALF